MAAPEAAPASPFNNQPATAAPTAAELEHASTAGTALADTRQAPLAAEAAAAAGPTTQNTSPQAGHGQCSLEALGGQPTQSAEPTFATATQQATTTTVHPLSPEGQAVSLADDQSREWLHAEDAGASSPTQQPLGAVSTSASDSPAAAGTLPETLAKPAPQAADLGRTSMPHIIVREPDGSLSMGIDVELLQKMRRERSSRTSSVPMLDAQREFERTEAAHERRRSLDRSLHTNVEYMNFMRRRSIFTFLMGMNTALYMVLVIVCIVRLIQQGPGGNKRKNGSGAQHTWVQDFTFAFSGTRIEQFLDVVFILVLDAVGIVGAQRDHEMLLSWYIIVSVVVIILMAAASLTPVIVLRLLFLLLASQVRVGIVYWYQGRAEVTMRQALLGFLRGLRDCVVWLFTPWDAPPAHPENPNPGAPRPSRLARIRATFLGPSRPLNQRGAAIDGFGGRPIIRSSPPVPLRNENNAARGGLTRLSGSIARSLGRTSAGSAASSGGGGGNNTVIAGPNAFSNPAEGGGLRVSPSELLANASRARVSVGTDGRTVIDMADLSTAMGLAPGEGRRPPRGPGAFLLRNSMISYRDRIDAPFDMQRYLARSSAGR